MPMLKRKVGQSKPAKFDHARRSASPQLTQAIETAHAATTALLRAKGQRTRADGDAARKGDTEVILANMTHATALERPGYTIQRGNTRRKRTRYGTTSASPSTLSQLDLLEEAGYLVQEKGYRGFPGMVPGQLTVVKPAAKWIEASAGLSLLDTVADHSKDELVMLKGTRLSDGEAADLIDYADSETTHALRAQVKAINYANALHVKRGDIEFIGDSLMSGYLVDVRDTFQQRYFNRGSFESGGRLFGGWWKPLGGEERRRDVRLMGEPVVELDVASMGVRLAYAFAGIAPPQGDLYGPRRFYRGPHDLAERVTLSRETIKTLTCAMLFDETPGRNRWPRGFERAGKGVQVTTVMDGIKAMHAPIAHLFGTAFGHFGMFMESTIMVETLLRLAVQGVPALDVHESIVAAESHVALAKSTFEATFEAHTGMLPVINSKRAEGEDVAELATYF